ncbi:class I SAM-dependent methyltransferase [Puia sp.]|jgi:predicted O-methyltransferase YrrM|uniref:class I SAM-dependent methyltransferase n=1 Tax=Puia sp. TaxID=2045100 RepID=UPI002F416B0C
MNPVRAMGDDIYALNLMQPLLKGTYLPFTLSSLRPACLAFILNDIVINDRKNVLEFGAGISTIMMGRLIKTNSLETRIISVEHNSRWVEILKGIVLAEGLEDHIGIVHAPLVPCCVATCHTDWYDTTVLEPVIGNRTFDMVLVDGPPAYEPPKMEARYPALPFVYNRLAARSILVLDDAEREGEKAVLARWTAEFPLRFNLAAGSLACSSRGDDFNAHL